jgi:lipopolysaccharide transport system permease protein
MLIFNELIQNATLLFSIVKREILLKYKHSFIGIFWALLTPLFLLCVYTFVFGYVFKFKWGGDLNQSNLDFALILFCGLMVLNFTNEIIGQSPTILLNHSQLITKMVFPIGIIPAIVPCVALVNFLISMMIWLAFNALHGKGMSVEFLVLIVVLPPVFILGLGLAYTFAIAGLIVRDLQHLATLITSTLLFVSPIFYEVDAVPPQFQIIFYINPLTHIIESMRKVMINHQLPSINDLILCWGFAIAALIMGVTIFQKFRRNIPHHI